MSSGKTVTIDGEVVGGPTSDQRPRSSRNGPSAASSRRSSTDRSKPSSPRVDSTPRLRSVEEVESPRKTIGSRKSSNANSRMNTSATESPASRKQSSRQLATPRKRDGITPVKSDSRGGFQSGERGGDGAAAGGRGGGGARYGRRANVIGSGSGKENGWFTETTERPKDRLLGNVPLINAEVDEAEHLAHQRRLKEEREKLSKMVADAPTNYQASMPRLADLDIKSSWDTLLQTIHSEYDMSCLTACLARELDEDIAWNPEMLLVQLMSEMRDANEVKDESAGAFGAFHNVDQESIGRMAGGELVRKRKERAASGKSPKVEGGDGKADKIAPSPRAAANGGGGKRSPGRGAAAKNVSSPSKFNSSTRDAGKDSSAQRKGRDASEPSSPSKRK